MARRYHAAWLVLCGWVALPASTAAQTRTNPEISVIGDIRVYSHSDTRRAQECERLNLADPQAELFISGYLNPYAHAAATVAWHGGGSGEIEEVYGTILRGLPLGVNLRAGKYRLEFGRLNPVHPHAYSFLETPLPHQVFFGEEGLSDVAVRASFLVPSGDVYTEVMGGVLKGDALFGHEHADEGEDADAHEHDASTRHNPGVLARLTTSLALGSGQELALGFSALNAAYPGHEHHDEEAGGEGELRAWVAGGDLKYKSASSRVSALQVELEVLARVGEQHEGEDLVSSGAYGYADYRFRQKYNAGGILEWVRTEYAHEHEGEAARTMVVAGEAEGEMETADLWRAGLFVGFAPIEETSLLRLVGRWTEPDDGEGFWDLTLQFVFSLGPHQPHNF